MLLAYAFAAGIVLFGIGTWMVARARAQKIAQPAHISVVTVMAWTRDLGVTDDSPLEAATRIDMIERLQLLGEPWCVEVLQVAALEESDANVQAAITTALATLTVPA